MSEVKSTRGRPSLYDPKYNELAKNYCLLGCTDKELSEFLGICEKTLNNWKEQFPDFLQSLREGKDLADQKVAQSLYEKALSGDTTSAIFWLKNRRKNHWRDKQEFEHSGQVTVEVMRYADTPPGQ